MEERVFRKQRDKGGIMTWEELKEKAKEMGYRYSIHTDTGVPYFAKNNIEFCENGNIMYNDTEDWGNTHYACIHYIAVCRTYDKMLMIMRGLE